MLQFLYSISDESVHSKIERIYIDYHENMIKYAEGLLSSMGRKNYRIDAEDAVQNAFIKITRYVYNIDFTLGKKYVKNYVFSILHNEICNLVKENKTEEELDENENFFVDDDIADMINASEKYNEIVDVIKKMDLIYSTTLFMYFCKEMTVNNIADVMGVSAKTVYTRLSRGKKHLMESLIKENLYEK